MLSRAVFLSLFAAGIGALMTLLTCWQENAPSSGSWIRRDFLTWRSQDGRSWVFQDFCSHFNLVRETWRAGDERPYTADGQLRLARAWLRDQAPVAQAFAYSPVLFCLLLPLLPFSTLSAYVAYAALTTAAAWFLYRRLFAAVPACIFSAAWGLVCAFSIDFWNVYRFGQTALLTTAGLAVLWMRTYDAAGRCWKPACWKEDLLLGAVLALLAAKPNLAFLGFVFLAAAGRGRALGIAALFCLLCTLAAAPVLGGWPVWAADYLHLLSHYTKAEIGPELAWSIDPRVNTHFASALLQAGFGPEPLLSRLCSAVLLACLAWTGYRLRHHPVQAPLLFPFALLSLLVFSPNLMHTEDVLLLLLVLFPPPGAVRLFFLAGWILLLNTNQPYGIFQGTRLDDLTFPLFIKFGFWLWYAHGILKKRPAADPFTSSLSPQTA
jgi:hypothetical protein